MFYPASREKSQLSTTVYRGLQSGKFYLLKVLEAGKQNRLWILVYCVKFENSSDLYRFLYLGNGVTVPKKLNK